MRTKKLTALISSLILAAGAIPTNIYAEDTEINPADWNNDGIINSTDVYYCISYINYLENGPIYGEELKPSGISIDKYIESEESIAETNKNHDMNGDGVVDKYDFIILAPLARGYSYPVFDDHHDVNFDCRIDIIDGYMIKYFIEEPDYYTREWANIINSYGDINEDGVVDMADADFILSGEYWRLINSNVGHHYTAWLDGTILDTDEKFEKYYGEFINDTTGRGDVNHDGSVDSIDATMILEYFANLATDNYDAYTEEEHENFQKYGDVFNDGIVNPLDASWVLSKYSDLSTPLAE